jgi:hypothetical protein
MSESTGRKARLGKHTLTEPGPKGRKTDAARAVGVPLSVCSRRNDHVGFSVRLRESIPLERTAPRAPQRLGCRLPPRAVHLQGECAGTRARYGRERKRLQSTEESRSILWSKEADVDDLPSATAARPGSSWALVSRPRGFGPHAPRVCREPQNTDGGRDVRRRPSARSVRDPCLEVRLRAL